MLRTPVSKKNSISVITVLIALILLVTVWPMRLYHETISYSGGAVVQISDPVTSLEDAGEYFTAQYDHLDSIEVYIESMEAGEYFTAQLFDQSNGGNIQLAIERVAFPQEDLPCYVTIPMDVDLVPGNVYVLILTGKVDDYEDAVFRVGFESAEEAASNPDAPIYNVAFHNDTGISGLALAMRTHYNEPLTKVKSAVLCGVIVLLAALALLLERLWFRRRPQDEHLIPLLRVLQYTLTPVIVVPAVLGVIAVFPLRLYDSRVMDVVTYELGILIAAAFLLYGLWRDRVGLPERFATGADVLAALPEILMVLDLAWIVQNACLYMNAVNDYTHHDCEARIVMGLAILILLMGKASWGWNRWTILAAIAGTIGGVYYYLQNRLGVDIHEYAEQNANLANKTASWVFLFVAAVSVIVMLVNARGSAHDHAAGIAAQNPRASRFSVMLRIVLVAFLAWTVVFRNGRDWLVLLAVVWGLLYIRYAFSPIRQDSGKWLRILSYGVILHFLCNVVWTMLHRYYLAYNYSRFSMQFHTVTITAYYLLIVSAAAVSLFLLRYREVCDLPRREQLRILWKEIGILGVVCSYMLMSMTRAGVYSLALMVLVGIVCTFRGTRAAVGAGNGMTVMAAGAETSGVPATTAAHTSSPLRRMGRTLVTMILITVISFLSVFTGQRLISTTVADPVIYEPVEVFEDVLLRHTPWNSTQFMNIEICIRDTLDRLTGGGIGSQIYYRLEWNIPQGYDTASLPTDGMAATARSAQDNGVTVARLGAPYSDAYRADYFGEGHLEARVSDEVLDGISTGNYTGDGISNGRTDIWRAYFAQMNLTGHEGMDLTLDNGEIAIHAHNILVQMMYDCGIPAGALFGVLLLLTLIGSWLYYRRRSGRDATALLPLLAMIGFGMTGMVEWIYQFDNPYTIVVLFILAPILFEEKDAV